MSKTPIHSRIEYLILSIERLTTYIIVVLNLGVGLFLGVVGGLSGLAHLIDVSHPVGYRIIVGSLFLGLGVCGRVLMYLAGQSLRALWRGPWI